jgi:hypothetical protein
MKEKRETDRQTERETESKKQREREREIKAYKRIEIPKTAD